MMPTIFRGLREPVTALYYAISQAMDEAGLQQEAISFVNAHGTATLYNDEMESKALHWAGLDHLPLNSMKSYWGHTLALPALSK